ncbi:MAG: hypothetical protein NUW08_04135, partial [Candidatus Uhrbacteria bacterium]|nr:hypothetical protein [Candidatus Uhrbacteria bacterium]
MSFIHRIRKALFMKMTHDSREDARINRIILLSAFLVMFSMMNGYGAAGGGFIFFALVSWLWLIVWT